MPKESISGADPAGQEPTWTWTRWAHAWQPSIVLVNDGVCPVLHGEIATWDTSEVFALAKEDFRN